MDIDALADQPGLNPSAEELLERIADVRRRGRTPGELAMSPETWRRLTGAATERFHGIPVALYEGCLGVAIVCDRPH